MLWPCPAASGLQLQGKHCLAAQGVPLIKERQKQVCFLLPGGCGETWISDAPKYSTQELMSNPDLVETGTALCPQLPVSRICVILRSAQQGSEASAADLSDFYELWLFCIFSYTGFKQEKEPGFYLKSLSAEAQCISRL